MSEFLFYSFIRYNNSNFFKNLNDKNSVIKYVFFLNKSVFLYYNKKQNIISISTIKTEFILISYVAKKNMEIKCFINIIFFKKSCLILNGNNETNISFFINYKNQSNLNYIDLKYNYIKEFINDKKFTIKSIPSAKILVNSMTKKLLTN